MHWLLTPGRDTSRIQLIREHVLARLPALSSARQLSAARATLRMLPQLLAEDRSFAPHLAAASFVPSTSGELQAPSALYDPRVPELATLLAGASTFPHSSLAGIFSLLAMFGAGLLSSIGQQASLLQKQSHVRCAGTSAAGLYKM